MMFHPKEPLYGPGPNPADEPDGWCRVCKVDTFEGVCDHCRGFKQEVEPKWYPNEVGQQMFAKVVDKIVTQSSDEAFHCLAITLFYNEER